MAIKVNNLSFGYIKRPLSVIDINFSAEDGDVILLCGGSQAGKSSLLSVLSGLEKQYFGNIFYDGVELRDIDAKERSISYILPNPVFFENKTILYNLQYQTSLNNIDMSYDQILNICKKFNFDFDIKKTKVRKLKSDDKKLLSVIRSYLKKPKYLFIDDISDKSGVLSEKIKNSIYTIINEKTYKKSIIMVDNCDFYINDGNYNKIFYLSFGRLNEFKNKLEIKDNPVDLYSLNYVKSMQETFYLAFDGNDYFLVKYDEIKSSKKGKVDFIEKIRIKLGKEIYTKLKNVMLADDQEIEVVLSSFDDVDLLTLSDEEITEGLKNLSLHLFEKNTCIKIV